ncbi:hypothetical protein [Desulforamulus aquiferis]|uniref:Lipoprotein n=1 Tax=Desulforamulus aquiferis TaxID=1397668 RepID=A0AAW7ZGG2_9FIRM|nr:hypothetical protein [Desulforamulus aquiferis]MDO7788320.1 hypothetical protein [Desulforamulus aquiferis]RYD04161.1 hypothetical protein N752_16415 [Desulforamulus aquiferis]
MYFWKAIKLSLILGLYLLIQGCSQETSIVEPVKQEQVKGKVTIKSEVGHQDENWLRVTGSVKNTSEYSVTAIESKVVLMGEGQVFDSRILTLSQGKVLRPGETLTFDSTFDYGSREVPLIDAEAEIVNLQVIQNK